MARLARLALTPDELERFTGQLGAVLEHAQDVAALDTAGVPPTAHPLPLANVWREDVVVAGLDRDEVLAQAPAVEAERFRVPRILGRGAVSDQAGRGTAVPPARPGAVEIAAAVRSGQVTARAVLEEHLARITAAEGDVHAFNLLVRRSSP